MKVNIKRRKGTTVKNSIIKSLESSTLVGQVFLYPLGSRHSNEMCWTRVRVVAIEAKQRHIGSEVQLVVVPIEGFGDVRCSFEELIDDSAEAIDQLQLRREYENGRRRLGRIHRTTDLRKAVDKLLGQLPDNVLTDLKEEYLPEGKTLSKLRKHELLNLGCDALRLRLGLEEEELD